MNVDVTRSHRTFHYRLTLEPDDRTDGRRLFEDAPTPFKLVHDEYRVELPPSFHGIHPDVHAFAIFHVLQPFIGSELVLPFPVSEQFAAAMLERHGVRLPSASATQVPRHAPAQTRPALLFSGGMDSMAASVVFPDDTDHLFLDRIPHAPRQAMSDVLIDLARQRDACAAVAALGRCVHATCDDHEYLCDPYPIWHSPMPPLAALYLCDSLGMAVFDGGSGLDTWAFGGYHDGSVTSWRYGRPERLEWFRDEFAPVGLRHAESIAGLSEVATTLIVARSPLRGRSFSCYYPSDETFCMRCDKCFKKLLLRHILEGEEIPVELFEHFLAIPRLAAIFARPYFDWHHVWYYLFQKIRCRHWFANELHRQAAAGPDLSLLEKWYPGSGPLMAPEYRDALCTRIQRHVDTMSPSEVVELEQLEVPPLHAPTRPVMAAVASPSAAFASEPPAATTALLRMLRSVLTLGPPPCWDEVAVADLRIAAGEQAVTVTLHHGSVSTADVRAEDRLELTIALISAGTNDTSCYARIGRLALSYRSSTPLDSPWRRAAIRALVRHLALVGRAGALPQRAGS